MENCLKKSVIGGSNGFFIWGVFQIGSGLLRSAIKSSKSEIGRLYLLTLLYFTCPFSGVIRDKSRRRIKNNA